MAVTIEQIAERAGVSPGTVSRVLNGLNKENRPAIAKRSAMIRRIAKELNYRPNHAARQMLRGRFDLIGYVNCGDLESDWFPRRLLHGINEKLGMNGSRLLVHEIPGSLFEDPAYVPAFMQQAMVDGVIVHMGTADPTQVSAVLDQDPLPVVYVNNDFPHHAVYPDEHANAYDATRRLIEAGHRKIGYYGPHQIGPLPLHFSEVRRRTGYEQAMNDHGLSPGFAFNPQPYDIDDALPHAVAYLDRCKGMTAAVCYSVSAGLNLHLAARLRGKTPPRDLCLVVFHEREFHAVTGIPLATSIIPFREIGHIAVDMVQRLADEQEPDASRSIAVRSSWFYDRGLIVPPTRKTT